MTATKTPVAARKPKIIAPTPTPTTKNILDIFNRAWADELRWGLQWYPTAHNRARDLDVNVSRAAGIIAALSPLNEWKNNLNKATLLYEHNGIICVDGTGNGIGLGKNVEKAQAIFFGADPLDVLGGDKVISFYKTINNPTGDFSPVIDRHAFDVAIGKVTNDDAKRVLKRKGVYDLFGNAYREAANTVGIFPSQMQAITWVTWRRIKGITD